MNKKLLVVLMCVILCFTFVACQPDAEPEQKNPNNDAKIDTAIVIDDMVATDIDFIKNGQTEYSIVVPDNADSRVLKSAKDIVLFVEKASGATLPLHFESDVQYSQSSKLIVLGCEDLIQSAGVEVDKSELGRTGYYLAQKDNSVFVLANHVFGVSNGVYGFLEHQISYRIYSETIMTWEESENFKLKTFNVAEIPEIEFRMWGNSMSEDCFRRMKMDSIWTVYANAGGEVIHTSLKYLPRETYGTLHPDWYNIEGAQLCYTARGNASEFALMVEEAAQKVYTALLNNPSVCCVPFAMMDAQVTCTCDACRESQKIYGTPTAAIIKFMNLMSARVDELLVQSDIDRKIDYIFFAYQDASAPPVVFNQETGKYEPIDETVIPADNVGILYAPMYANYTDSWYDESNESYRDQTEQWLALTNNIYLYLYQTYFWDYLFPFNSFKASVDTMKYFDEQNVTNYYSLSQGQLVSTGFHELKDYLERRFLWDLDLDYTTVLKEYFGACYGEGGTAMYKFFDSMTTYFEIQENLYPDIKNIWGNIREPNIWSYPVLKEWEGYILEAFTAIEPLKATDPEKYQLYYDGIDLEYLSVKYALIEFCEAYYSVDEMLALKISFKESATRLGVTENKEHGSLSVIYKDWGI